MRFVDEYAVTLRGRAPATGSEHRASRPTTAGWTRTGHPVPGTWSTRAALQHPRNRGPVRAHLRRRPGASALARRIRRVGRKRVERLMRSAGLQGAFLRTRLARTQRDRTRARRRRRIWSTATSPRPRRTGSGSPTPPGSPAAKACSGSPRSATCSPTGSSGGRPPIAATPNSILVALEYGIWSRDVRDGQLIHHSDRGSNYTTFRFSARLRGPTEYCASMGSVGDSYDNALMENFWSTLKIELVYRTSWRTRKRPRTRCSPTSRHSTTRPKLSSSCRRRPGGGARVVARGFTAACRGVVELFGGQGSGGACRAWVLNSLRSAVTCRSPAARRAR